MVSAALRSLGVDPGRAAGAMIGAAGRTGSQPAETIAACDDNADGTAHDTARLDSALSSACDN